MAVLKLLNTVKEMAHGDKIDPEHPVVELLSVRWIVIECFLHLGGPISEIFLGVVPLPSQVSPWVL